MLLFPRIFISTVALFAWAALSAQGQNYTYTINTVVGTDRLRDGGPATGSLLRRPEAVVADSAGNLYIADTFDNRVRKVDPSGVITTYAGDGSPDYFGDGGRAVAASLDEPNGLALDAAGNLYISDFGNNVVRVVSPAGVITTYAGTGDSTFGGDHGPATEAGLSTGAIALDPAGNLYIADNANYRIRKVDTKGIITTVAGNGTRGFSGDGGPATNAELTEVLGLAIDSKGNLFLSDIGNGRVREVSTAGLISTVAGTEFGDLPVTTGPATSQTLSPSGIAFDANGLLYISDVSNSRIVILDPAQNTLTLFAGDGAASFSGDGGPATSAAINYPGGIFVEPSGTVLFADVLNQRIRQVTNGVIHTIAGASAGDAGPAAAAFLNHPQGVAIDKNGNLLIADTENQRLRSVALTANGNIQSVGTFGYQADKPLTTVGDPVVVATSASGDTYVVTVFDLLVKLDANGQQTTIAGEGSSDAEGVLATQSSLLHVTGLTVDGAGNIYLAENGRSRVRKISTLGLITTIAGNGSSEYSGDGGLALNAGMDPFDVALDAKGNLLIADFFNSRVRLVDTTGKISTIAGNGQFGYSGDRGPAIEASIGWPSSLALDAAGALYISDFFNEVVWRVGPTGYIATIAGTGVAQPASGDGGPATLANLDPLTLTVDGEGDVFVVDYANDRVRELTPTLITLQSFTKTSGDNQSAGLGNPLAQPLAVKLTGSDGFGYYGAAVTFAVTSGSATLSATSAVTDGNGAASVTVTLGQTVGTVMVTATVDGITPVTFTLNAVPVPVISVGGIIGAGGSVPPISAISPNGIFSIYGTGLAPAGTAQNVQASDVINGALPTNLAGTCVEVGGQRAPLFYVSDKQINAQAPSITLGSAVNVDVITGCDTGSDAKGTVATVIVQATTPEFFNFGQTADAKSLVIATNFTEGGFVGPPGFVAGLTFAAAKPNDIIVLYGTGFGGVNPIIAPGVLPVAAANVTASVAVQLGGVTVDSANVLYVGLAPGYAGLYQVNLRIPAGTPAGEQTLVITVDGVPSPATAVVQIGS